MSIGRAMAGTAFFGFFIPLLAGVHPLAALLFGLTLSLVVGAALDDSPGRVRFYGYFPWYHRSVPAPVSTVFVSRPWYSRIFAHTSTPTVVVPRGSIVSTHATAATPTYIPSYSTQSGHGLGHQSAPTPAPAPAVRVPSGSTIIRHR